MDQAKLAKLQAQAASRIGALTLLHPLKPLEGVIKICTSLTPQRCRREGHRAAKDRAQIKARKRAGRQEAPGRAQEAERTADRGRRGGEHVQRGWQRPAFQRSEG